MSFLSLSGTFKFVTVNTNGIRDAVKRASFIQWLIDLRPDFECLLEAHVLSCEDGSSWFSSVGFQAVSSPVSAHACGSIILFRPVARLVNSWADREGRFVLAEFECQEVLFRVACVYAPNRNPDREIFYAYIEDMIDPAVPTVMGGDFNVVFNRSVDRRGSNALDHFRYSYGSLRSLFRNCCMMDIWRHLHPSERGLVYQFGTPTWRPNLHF